MRSKNSKFQGRKRENERGTGEQRRQDPPNLKTQWEEETATALGQWRKSHFRESKKVKAMFKM